MLTGVLDGAANLVAFAASSSLAMVTLLTLVSLSGIAFGLHWPRALVAVTVAASLFVQPLENILPVPSIGSADEALVGLCVICIVAPRLLRGRLEHFPGWSWFAAFALLGVLSALFRDVPLGIAGAGLALATKGLAVGIAAAQLEWSAANIRLLARGGAAVLVFALACGIANAALPGPWTAALTLGGLPEFQGGLPALRGPWTHPSHYGQVMGLLAIGCLAYRQAFGRGSALWTFAAAVAALLSLRRKTFVGLLTALGALSVRRHPAILLFFGLPLVAAVSILTWATLQGVVNATWIQYVIEADETPRTVLMAGSVQVANDYFPLGAGFGRYGSYTAFANYSPEYVRLGFEAIYGLGIDPSRNRFATDTFWPAVWGEAGWLGGLAYFLGLATMGIAILDRLRRKQKTMEVHWLALLSLGWYIQLVLESVAAPVFSAPPTYPLLFTAVGILVASSRQPKSVAPGAKAGKAGVGTEIQHRGD